MISLCTFVKNEEHCIEHMLASVIDVVSEIVVVDTGSTDRTIEICRDYTNRVYQVGFTDFGHIRTITGHLAREPWVLMLDADETLSDSHYLEPMAKSKKSMVYALPRKRWLDLEMEEQTEMEAYPDWQVRFYYNLTRHEWKRELHEYFHGGSVLHVDNGPIIHHFQDVFKGPAQQQERRDLYESLAPKAGVAIHGGHEI